MNERAGSSSNDTSPTVDELRRGVEHARADLADSINELRHRLTPAEVLAQTRSSVQEYAEQATATLAARLREGAGVAGREARRRRDQVEQALREQPGLAAVATAAAAGAIWILSRDRSSSAAKRRRAQKRVDRRPTPAPVRVDPAHVAAHLPLRADPVRAAAYRPATPDPAAEADPGVSPGARLAPARTADANGRASQGQRASAVAAAVVGAAVLARRGPVGRGHHLAEEGGPTVGARASAAAARIGERAEAAVAGVRKAGARVGTSVGTMDAGSAAALGTIIGVAAALLTPRSHAEAQLAGRVQSDVARRLSTTMRLAADEARRNLVPTLSALVDSTSSHPGQPGPS